MERQTAFRHRDEQPQIHLLRAVRAVDHLSVRAAERRHILKIIEIKAVCGVDILQRSWKGPERSSLRGMGVRLHRLVHDVRHWRKEPYDENVPVLAGLEKLLERIDSVRGNFRSVIEGHAFVGDVSRHRGNVAPDSFLLVRTPDDLSIAIAAIVQRAVIRRQRAQPEHRDVGIALLKYVAERELATGVIGIDLPPGAIAEVRPHYAVESIDVIAVGLPYAAVSQKRRHAAWMVVGLERIGRDDRKPRIGGAEKELKHVDDDDVRERGLEILDEITISDE